MTGWLAATILLGGIFIIGQGLEYWSLFKSGVSVELEFVRDDIFHPHRLSRLARVYRADRAADRARICCWPTTSKKAFTRAEAVGLYWHFVDAVWVFVLSVVYILPHLR